MRPDKYIVGMFLTLLPPRFREGMHLRGPAITCALIQILAPILIILIRLFRLAAAEQSSIPGDSMEMFLKFGGNYVAVSAVAGAIRFWSHPLHMFLYYVIFEGAVRILSALEGERILGSLPLHAVAALYDWRKRAEHKRLLGPAILDEVVRGGQKEGYDLKIYSCRAKLEWNPYTTVQFEGEFYQMYKEEPGPSPRRFVYYLRKNPVGRIVVTIEHYRIDDALQAPRDKNSLQQLAAKLSSSLDPVMEDQILRGNARSDYDFKIYSSHPKLEWDSQATIEIENHLYEMFKEESGSKPRRFVYYLRRNPAGRLPKKILSYTPVEMPGP